MADGRKISVAGNYRKRIIDVESVSFSDFYNPWSFYALFMCEDDVVWSWLSTHGLLLQCIPCGRRTCNGDMTMARRTGRPLSRTLRCSVNRDHEVSCLKHSFFERTKMDVRDVMEVLRCYLEGHSLKRVSVSGGISYGSSAVDWTAFIREMFKEHFYVNTKHTLLSGEIELDESLFGRRVKYHRGNPNKGVKIWVFGMVERLSNRLILYPVGDRSARTLVPIIQRHVAPGSTIYSDGFSSYCRLNEMGYRHFTVLHKYSFKKIYKNEVTGETVECHTNRIEGAWKHAKDYFRRMSGTKPSQWEGHMAEVMWRSEVKGNQFSSFFELLRSVYTLAQPVHFSFPTPLFDTWDGFNSQSSDMVLPACTDESSDTQSDGGVSMTSEIDLILDSDEDFIPAAQRPREKFSRRMRMLSEIMAHSSISESSDTEEPTVLYPIEESTILYPIEREDDQQAPTPQVPGTSTPKPPARGACGTGIPSTSASSKPVRGSDHVCCPAGFQQTKSEGARKKHSKSAQSCGNPYTKSNYEWGNWSSDDDFEQSRPKARASVKSKGKGRGKKTTGK